MYSNRLFMALGDVKDVSVRGGSPFFLFRAGRRRGLFDKGASIEIGKDKWARRVWNLMRAVRYGEVGGYQYGKWSAERRFKAADLYPTDVTETMSQFPLFPPDSWLRKVETSYYIDATFHQNFREAGARDRVSARMRREAIARERERYQQASRIFCMSEWAATSIVHDYNVLPAKVHVVAPGANIDEDDLSGLDVIRCGTSQTIRLGFNGKDWRRKNLVFLLAVAEELEASGFSAEVWAAGFSPAKGPHHRLLRSFGFLDKRRDMRAFVGFVRSVHFGALFSLADASSIANREFLRLGVPVLTRDVGGVKDTVPDGVGKVFCESVSPADVAQYIVESEWAGSAYDELRRRVVERAEEFSWTHTVEKFKSVWDQQRSTE